jgi:transposase
MDMDIKAFYSKLLGVKGVWSIREVVVDDKGARVDIYMEHRDGVKFPCPVCREFCSVYDHTPEREFRHLNTCQMQTWLHARLPRIECPTHGVQQITHGIAEDNTGMTFAFEELVLMLERECSLESVGRVLDLDWHSCQRVQARAVERGMARKPRRIPENLGVDEKAFAKGHHYETLVYDNDNGTVEYVCDDREEESLVSYYLQFTKEELAAVKSVTLDMWPAYIGATKLCVPDAEKKMVFDKFHVIRYVVDAVDKVRKEEHATLSDAGNTVLAGTKYLWLWNSENMPPHRVNEFEALRKLDLKVCRAWAIKEHLQRLWSMGNQAWMRRFFRSWFWWASHSRLKPMISAAKTLKAHLENIVTYAKHRITNALGESLNSRIEKVKRLACGFRNRENYKIAIYFHCGGLDLMPRRTRIAMQAMTS